MNPEERRAFVLAHRLGVFGYSRKPEGPAMSLVYYVLDDNDDLLISTIAARGAVTDLMMRIGGLMAGNPLPESVRDMVRQGALAEKRVRLRLHPYATFESPPRHVHSEADVEGLTHDLGRRQPW